MCNKLQVNILLTTSKKKTVEIECCLIRLDNIIYKCSIKKIGFFSIGREIKATVTNK